MKKSLLSLTLFPQGIFFFSFPFYLVPSEGDMFILLKKVSYKDIEVCLMKVYVFLLPLSRDRRPPTPNDLGWRHLPMIFGMLLYTSVYSLSAFFFYTEVIMPYIALCFSHSLTHLTVLSIVTLLYF